MPAPSENKTKQQIDKIEIHWGQGPAANIGCWTGEAWGSGLDNLEFRAGHFSQHELSASKNEAQGRVRSEALGGYYSATNPCSRTSPVGPFNCLFLWAKLT